MPTITAGDAGQPHAEDPEDVCNPLLPDDRDDKVYAEILARGVRLFRHLVAQANAGQAVGVGYAGFVRGLYGVADYAEVAGRSYKPGDTKFIIRLASLITEAAGERQTVTRGAVTIRAGMDTFIWNQRPPYVRSVRAWYPGTYRPPYSRAEWNAVFPDRERRLITDDQCSAICAAEA